MNYLAQDFSSIQSSAGVSAPSSVASLVTNMLPYIYGAAGIVLLFNIVSSGLKMMTSQGDPKALQGAQSKLSTSVIGILILALSFVLVDFIMTFLGINIKIFG